MVYKRGAGATTGIAFERTGWLCHLRSGNRQSRNLNHQIFRPLSGPLASELADAHEFRDSCAALPHIRREYPD